MDQVRMEEEVVFELLERGTHDRENFECGETSLNNFLQRNALKEQKLGFSKTYVAIDALKANNPKIILGYYTLSNGKILMSDLPKDMTKKLPDYDGMPSILIGRLARNLNQSPKGFGKILLADAIKKVSQNSAGVYALEVEAINDNVKAYYMSFGFIPYEENQTHLFVPIKTIQGLI